MTRCGSYPLALALGAGLLGLVACGASASAAEGERDELPALSIESLVEGSDDSGGVWLHTSYKQVGECL